MAEVGDQPITDVTAMVVEALIAITIATIRAIATLAAFKTDVMRPRPMTVDVLMLSRQGAQFAERAIFRIVHAGGANDHSHATSLRQVR